MKVAVAARGAEYELAGTRSVRDDRPTRSRHLPGTTMILEISSVSYSNKGDCLMLLSAIDAMSEYDRSLVFAQRLQVRTWETAKRLGVRSIAYLAPAISSPFSLRPILNRLLRARPVTSLVSHLGPLLPYSGVHAVLDISGYSYGDSFGLRKAEGDLARFREAKRYGQKIILLPKTYGPFTDSTRASLVAEILRTVDCGFVRDRTSLQYLRAVCPFAPNIHLFPDYTSRCPGVHSARYAHLEGRACLIPNYRAVDKVPGQSLTSYVHMLLRIHQKLEQERMRPFVLLHQFGEDRAIARAMETYLSSVIVVQEEDPRVLKGIIARSGIVVSSRLHGVINALNQGVPVIALGWSHKYEEVMREYGVAEYCVLPPFIEESILYKIGKLTADGGERAAFTTKVLEGKTDVETRNETMWKMVAETLGLRRP